VRLRDFRRVVLIAALVLGSHAMHDTFAVIRWSAAGISPQAVTVLWSMAVASEVVMFLMLGPWLLKNVSPASAIAIAACAGALRWTVAALTADVFALALIQPLHGITFALFHLASMRLLARIVPADLAATGLALYGTVGAGISGAAVTLSSGWLYTWMGAGGFMIMSLLCVAAFPLVYALRASNTDADAVERKAAI
jgi:MFS transporter, PPP family, 3-phenylpropionic acid transporter